MIISHVSFCIFTTFWSPCKAWPDFSQRATDIHCTKSLQTHTEHRQPHELMNKLNVRKNKILVWRGDGGSTNCSKETSSKDIITKGTIGINVDHLGYLWCRWRMTLAKLKIRRWVGSGRRCLLVRALMSGKLEDRETMGGVILIL